MLNFNMNICLSLFSHRGELFPVCKCAIEAEP